MRLKRAALLFAFAGCATTSSSTTTTTPSTSTPAAAAPAEPQKLAITNLIPFDVASCGPRALTLSPLTAEVLTGAMLSMTPATQECFIDPQHRDGQPFDLKAKLTVAEAGVSVELTGTGASPAGKACVEAALKKLPLQPLAAGAKPVSAEVPIGAAERAVRLGQNVADDIAGRLRLAQPSLCECYASIGTQAPPTLKVEVETVKNGPFKMNFVGAEPLTTCVSTKLAQVKLPDERAKLTWPFLLKNSYAAEVDAAAPAALRFQQLDGMRAQRTADVLVAAGQRSAAAIAFDDLAQKYKKKPAKGMLEELKARCATVIERDDQQLGAVKALVGVLQDSQKLAMTEKAKDPQWAQVEPMLAQQLTTSTAEVTRVEEQKKNDLNACPKTR